MRTPSVVAIGAANIDINGYSTSALLHEESNPGRVELCAGGVARNIAENLARLGVEVELLTALGGDGLQRLIIESCRAAGVGYSYCAVDVTMPSSFYMAVLDCTGEMDVAVCDMSLADKLLTPAFLKSKRDLLEQADILVADAGLLRDPLCWLTREMGHKKLFLDTVSIKRCDNVEGLLPFFHTVKMNGHEALRLAGESSDREPTPQEAVQLAGEFVRRGQTRCYITLGRNGVAFAQRGGSCGHLPALPVTVRGASGAGDAFMAGAVYARHVAGADGALCHGGFGRGAEQPVDCECRHERAERFPVACRPPAGGDAARMIAGGPVVPPEKRRKKP